MNTFKVFIGVLILVATVMFAVQNAEVVDLKFLLWSISTPRALLVIVLLAAGIILGVLWSSIARMGGDKAKSED